MGRIIPLGSYGARGALDPNLKLVARQHDPEPRSDDPKLRPVGRVIFNQEVLRPLISSRSHLATSPTTAWVEPLGKTHRSYAYKPWVANLVRPEMESARRRVLSRSARYSLAPETSTRL